MLQKPVDFKDSFDSHPAACLYFLEIEGPYRLASEEEVRHAALAILASAMCTGPVMSSPSAVRDYLLLRLAALEYEVFAVLLLDAQHRVIEYREMFRGTLT